MSDDLIGQEIEAFCSKCKKNTLHLITAIDGEKIEKVMCKVCVSYHKYKKPIDSTIDLNAKKSKAKPTKKRKTVSRRSKWIRILDKIDSDSAIEYEMDKSYEVENAIHHKTFGLGVVKNVIDEQKIEVVFHDGEKLLVQNYIL